MYLLVIEGREVLTAILDEAAELRGREFPLDIFGR